jgi:ATP-dependent Clp protease adaptor protein ClpS
MTAHPFFLGHSVTDTATQSETSLGLRVPNLWNVKILNDDFTPIDFVIEVLMYIFKKDESEAIDMTLRVHEDGAAIVGTYTKDIAMTKCDKATKLAESEGHPLRLVPEPSA